MIDRPSCAVSNSDPSRMCLDYDFELTLLSPPSYTARAVRKDSVLRKAFRSMKFWNLEYAGGEFAAI